jgi:hypothetical protein
MAEQGLVKVETKWPIGTMIVVAVCCFVLGHVRARPFPLMNMYVLLGGIAIAVAIFFGGYGAARGRTSSTRAGARRRARPHVVRQQIVIKEVPKIVTKVVRKEVTVEKEVERVVIASNTCSLLTACFLVISGCSSSPPRTESIPAGVPDEIAGIYGCRETLAAAPLRPAGGMAK